MSVTPVTGASAAPRETPAPRANVDYQSFLKLLVAQARNQDPTNPMDPTAYMSQLAAFSSVEQAIQTNARLDEILRAGGLARGAGLVGLSASSADGAVSGVVRSVAMLDGKTIATLEGGARLMIGDGVVVSRP